MTSFGPSAQEGVFGYFCARLSKSNAPRRVGVEIKRQINSNPQGTDFRYYLKRKVATN